MHFTSRTPLLPISTISLSAVAPKNGAETSIGKPHSLTLILGNCFIYRKTAEASIALPYCIEGANLADLYILSKVEIADGGSDCNSCCLQQISPKLEAVNRMDLASSQIDELL